ncbi:hypothetical protein [Mucilaginibacter flavidus]|uniref:hypothetical protein n=1 Tax=Mucilaginibacter flavidus TaxID=2949309 RepID=UPI002093FFF8|nr:hypothetical protein [Mucilaginibacter flavidus]MCO5950593.1 hypothetical protein [Mucilaginibacter flavidus]
MMKRNLLLISLLVISTGVFAQTGKFQKEIDSAKSRFWQADSLRRMHRPKDTVRNALEQSPFVTIYQEPKAIIVGVHLVQLQLVRFRHEYFLNVVVRAGLIKPVVVMEKAGLELSMADGKTIKTASLGRAVPRGSEVRNSSNLSMIYRLTADDAKRLKAGTLNSIKIAYDSGQWSLSTTPSGAINLTAAIKTI